MTFCPPPATTFDPGVALVQFTSGTTGGPSRCCSRTTACSACSTAWSPRSAAARRRGGRAAVPMPNLVPVSLSLWAGIYNVLFAFRVGAPVVVMDRFDDRGVRRAGAAVRDPLDGAAARRHDDARRRRRPSPTSPRCGYVRSITAPLSPLQARRFHDRFGVAVLNSYGQTEIGGEIVGWTAADAGPTATTSSARSAARTPASRSASTTRPASCGCAPRRSARAYADGRDLGRPADRRRLVPHRRRRPGRRRRLRLDRGPGQSDMINRGGLKVFPAEVEEVLRLAPGVADAAVVGVPDDRLGEVPWAFVVPAAHGGLRRRGPGRLVPRAPGALQGARAVRDGRRPAPQRGGQGAEARAGRASGGSVPMRLHDSPAEAEFRAELRAWLAARCCRASRPSPPPTTTGTPAAPTTPPGSACSSTPATPGINWPAEYGGRGATPSRAADLPRGDRAGPGALRRAATSSALLHAGPDAHRRGHAPSSRPPTCPASCGATRCGARASPSPRPAPTWPRSAPGRSATATTTSSPARRSGPRTPRSPTTARCSSAPTPTRPSTGHHVADHADGHARHRGAAAARRSPGSASSARCSSTRCGSRSPTGSATRTTAGGWRWSRSASSGARRSSASCCGSMRLAGRIVAARARRGGRAAWDDASIRRELGHRRRRARRPLGADPAQRLAGGATGRARRRRVGLQARTTPRPASGWASWPIRVLDRAGLAMDDPADLATADHVEQTALRPVALDRRRAPRRSSATSSASACSACPRSGEPMDFELSDDQAALQEELRRFLAARFTSDDRRAAPSEPAGRRRPRALARAGRHRRVRAAAARGRRRRRPRPDRGGRSCSRSWGGRRARSAVGTPPRGRSGRRGRDRRGRRGRLLLDRRRRLAARRAPRRARRVLLVLDVRPASLRRASTRSSGAAGRAAARPADARPPGRRAAGRASGSAAADVARVGCSDGARAGRRDAGRPRRGRGASMAHRLRQGAPAVRPADRLASRR